MKTAPAIFGMILFGGAGFAGGYFLSKRHYEKLADAEVESTKRRLQEYFSKTLYKEKPAPAPKKETTVKKTMVEEATEEVIPKVVTPLYDYSKPYSPATATPNDVPFDTVEQAIDEAKLNGIYVITPEEFNESEAKCETLYYFSDGVLADDDDNEIKLVNLTVGKGTLDRFKKYGVDVIYVRNTNFATDYEICLDERKYEDVKKKFVDDDTEDTDD